MARAADALPRSGLPALEVGKPLPARWLRLFRNEGLRRWVQANVVCGAQPVADTRFGISAGEQLLITPEVFNGGGLSDPQRVSLLAFELGKVFYQKEIEPDPSLKAQIEPVLSADYASASYRSVQMRGSGPDSLHLGDIDNASLFSYLFRAEILALPVNTAGWEQADRVFQQATARAIAAVQPPEDSSLAGWAGHVGPTAQAVESQDQALGKQRRWEAIKRWTLTACRYMRDPDGPDDASRTYLLNNFVALPDTEIAAGLARDGDQLLPCQLELIATLRSASGPLDAAWLVGQFSEQREAYNARRREEAAAHAAKIAGAKDPVIEAFKAVTGLVRRGVAKVANTVTAPFVSGEDSSSDAGGSSRENRSSGDTTDHGSGRFNDGAAYRSLRGIAASGGGIPP